LENRVFPKYREVFYGEQKDSGGIDSPSMQ